MAMGDGFLRKRGEVLGDPWSPKVAGLLLVFLKGGKLLPSVPTGLSFPSGKAVLQAWSLFQNSAKSNFFF